MVANILRFLSRAWRHWARRPPWPARTVILPGPAISIIIRLSPSDQISYSVPNSRDEHNSTAVFTDRIACSTGGTCPSLPTHASKLPDSSSSIACSTPSVLVNQPELVVTWSLKMSVSVVGFKKFCVFSPLRGDLRGKIKSPTGFE